MIDAKILWKRCDDWLKENASMIALGSAIAVTFALWNTSSVFTAEVQQHDDNCTSLRERFTDVSTFWNGKASDRGSHSQHEIDAKNVWNAVSGDVTIRKDAKLAQDVAQLASIWQQLSDDDFSEAQRDQNYVVTLARDYNRGCGSAPTPLPETTIFMLRIPPTPAHAKNEKRSNRP